MKKLNVVDELCIGCGACVAIDPEHFEFNEEGKSSVISNENLESSNLTNAIESCPTSAIHLSESDEEAVEKTENENIEEDSCKQCECLKCNDHHEESNDCHCHECDCHKDQKKNAEND